MHQRGMKTLRDHLNWGHSGVPAPLAPFQSRSSARRRASWPQRICECGLIATIYVALALLGQRAAIAPGNVTPIYPAAGFAIAGVLLRGRHVWPGIWLGQLLGNAWAFVDFSAATVTFATSLAAVATAFGAVVQALFAAYLIEWTCGTSNPFRQLRHLFAFVVVVVIACWTSAATGVVGMAVSGVILWERFGATIVTWYFGDLVGTVLFLPLILTCLAIVRDSDTKRRAFEMGLVLSPLMLLGALSYFDYVPLQLASNVLLIITLPLTLWAAFRLAQPGVAVLVNTIGLLAAFITIRGVGPFFTDNAKAALGMFQLVTMIMMIAGLSLAIAIEQLKNVQASFRKLGLAIDRAGDAVFLVRPDARFEYANARATKLLGYTSAQLMSMAVFDIDPNFTPDAWPDVWSKVRQEELHFKSVVRREDGCEIPIDVSVGHMEVDGQELACAILKDISSRMSAEDVRGVFEQILNGTSAVVYQKDIQGRYEFVNDRWRHLFNIDLAHAKGKTDYDLFPRSIAAEFRQNDDRVMETGQSIKIEETAPHSDGPHTYISVKFPIWDRGGNLHGIAGISTDISEQLAAKEELKNTERLATIGKMITGLAHECRNALQRSQACLSMLTREVTSNTKALDYAARLQQAQDDLQRAFEELRGYASPLHLEKTRCDLRALLETTWKNIMSVPNPPGVGLRITDTDLDLTCTVDGFRIQQVFRNVLENAISSAPAKSTIVVSWSKAQLTSGSALGITIQDEGAGFSPQQRAKAFKPFYTTKATGTGLGLTICQRIMQCHGGQIDIAADSDCGGIVVITLPQQERNEP